MIERFHRSLKFALRARLAGSDWVHYLPLVMLGLCSAPKDDFGFSPAEAVYGAPLSLPGEFIEHSEISSEFFFRRVENAISRFSGPQRLHLAPSLSLCLFLVPSGLWSLCLCARVLRSLRLPQSTKVLTRCSDAVINFLSCRLEILLILCLWTD